MAKRAKKLGKGVESLKKEKEDISEGRGERGLYHIKEIDKSLLKALEIKIEMLGSNDNSVQIYRKRLNELKKNLNLM